MVRTTVPLSFQKMNIQLILTLFDYTKKTEGGSYYLKIPIRDVIHNGLCHKHQISGKEMSAFFKRDILIFLGGMKRTIAKEKIKSGETFNEGKTIL